MTAATAAASYAVSSDCRFMDMALALGRRELGRTWPNPAVGAIVVREERDGPVVIGRGWTQAGGRPHAETEALRRAGDAVHGATLYVSLEPCSHHGRTPPCANAIIAAGIRRVVSALDDPNPEVAGRGHARMRAAGIAVEVGVGAAEARRAHAGHIRRMRDGRPHVTLKLAVSADEKGGLAGRRPVAITGPEAQARVHMLRAQSDAVLIGIGTALADDPLLTCRLPGMADRSPVRVVLDTQLRLPLDSKLAMGAREVPVWAIASPDVPAANVQAIRERGVEVLPADMCDGRINLAATLRLLAEKGITRLMVEGGPITATSFLAAELVDEAMLLRSAHALGVDAIDALEGVSLSELTGSPRLVSQSSESLGADTLEIFERAD